MSLFGTKKTELMIIFGLFIQQSGNPAPPWIHQNVMHPPTWEEHYGNFDLSPISKREK
jgi:hypothetical protein